MSETNSTTVWHAIEDGLTVPPPELHGVARVLKRGNEIDVSAELIEASRDGYGNSAYSDLSDAAQLARWGKIFLAPGRLEDDPELASALVQERLAASAQRDVDAKREAARYGRRHAQGAV